MLGIGLLEGAQAGHHAFTFFASDTARYRRLVLVCGHPLAHLQAWIRTVNCLLGRAYFSPESILEMETVFKERLKKRAA